MLEDARAADQREEEAIDRAPEVGGMADVVHVALSHVPAVQKIQRCEDIPRDRNGNKVDIDAHLGLKEDGRKEDGRNRSGCTYSVVIPIVPVLHEVPDARYGDGADIQDDIQHDACRLAECQGEILLHDTPEEIEREHVE